MVKVANNDTRVKWRFFLKSYGKYQIEFLDNHLEP